jgi:hypothetical protein
MATHTAITANFACVDAVHQRQNRTATTLT